MKKTASALLACLTITHSFVSLASPSDANKPINVQEVTNFINCFGGQFTNYEKWRGFIKDKYAKKSKSEEILNKRLAWFDSMFGQEDFNKYKANLSCYNFTYPVDGGQVHGYIIKPKEHEQDLPTLIYNRGGNGRFGAVVFGSMMHNLFPIANEGFVIIGSQYRGSFSQKNDLDEFGGQDVKDVTALLKYIPDISGADATRIGMFGYSRGGMQTHLAVKQAKGAGIKAIATLAGNTNLLRGLDYRPAMEKVYSRRIPSYQKNKQTELANRSVLTWVDELSKEMPILLIHGSSDKKVSVQHSLDFAHSLTEHKVPHKLVIYKGDDHGLKENKQKADQEIVSWFKAHL